MAALKYALRNKRWASILKRTKLIVQRYGITSKNMRDNLNLFEKILDKYECGATIPIPAVVLKRHRKMMMQEFNKQCFEFAIHGFVHNDYSTLSIHEQELQLQKATDIFNDLDINAEGFRGPYLGWNEDTLAVLKNAGIIYDSDETFIWDVIDEVMFPSRCRSAYHKILQMYKPNNAREYIVIPHTVNGLVRIPVSLPDDEMLVDRLNITGSETGEIWKNMLDESYVRGELFTLQLHPERIRICARALETVLAESRNRNPGIWIAQLREIAKWWKERSKFSMEIKGKDGEYVVDIDCSDEATILLKNNIEIEQAKEWYSDYKTMDCNAFKVKSSFPPFIGVCPGAPKGLVSLLKEEGFYVEESTAKDKFKIYFDFDYNDFEERDKLSIIRKIDGSDAPLVRIWKWPHGARSALSITGDIDAMNIWDYVRRIIGM
jgi:peptidoglycan/xylan/chitin deacetylase (PgdA/CDA1 family)